MRIFFIPTIVIFLMTFGCSKKRENTQERYQKQVSKKISTSLQQINYQFQKIKQEAQEIFDSPTQEIEKEDIRSNPRFFEIKSTYKDKKGKEKKIVLYSLNEDETNASLFFLGKKYKRKDISLLFSLEDLIPFFESLTEHAKNLKFEAYFVRKSQAIIYPKLPLNSEGFPFSFYKISSRFKKALKELEPEKEEEGITSEQKVLSGTTEMVNEEEKENKKKKKKGNKTGAEDSGESKEELKFPEFKTDQPLWTKPYLNKVTNKFVSSFITPLTKGFELLGVLGFDLNLNAFSSYLFDGKTSALFILDEGTNLIAINSRAQEYLKLKNFKKKVSFPKGGFEWRKSIPLKETYKLKNSRDELIVKLAKKVHKLSKFNFELHGRNFWIKSEKIPGPNWVLVELEEK